MSSKVQERMPSLGNSCCFKDAANFADKEKLSMMTSHTFVDVMKKRKVLCGQVQGGLDKKAEPVMGGEGGRGRGRGEGWAGWPARSSRYSSPAFVC
jgi:hypothetical protein